MICISIASMLLPHISGARRIWSIRSSAQATLRLFSARKRSWLFRRSLSSRRSSAM